VRTTFRQKHLSERTGQILAEQARRMAIQNSCKIKKVVNASVKEGAGNAGQLRLDTR